jgi:hypothetical protein
MALCFLSGKALRESGSVCLDAVKPILSFHLCISRPPDIQPDYRCQIRTDFGKDVVKSGQIAKNRQNDIVKNRTDFITIKIKRSLS